jgi:apoptosis-inducing factor 2
MSRVVVVGGGYAGTAVAKALDTETEVILIDPRDSFVNVSSSMRAMVRPDWADRPFFSYERLLARGRIIRDSVVSADPTGVTLAHGERVDADYLVLATGSAHSYPARPRLPTTGAAEAATDLRATGEQLAKAGRVLILGAGPVGLELAGEIREAWPDKHVTVVDRSAQALPGYLPEVREELYRQLDALDIELQLNTALESMPMVQDGTAGEFTVRTTNGREILANIWFRCIGAQPNTRFLDDGALTTLTGRRTVPVDEHLNVIGHAHVYALGDIAELPDAKMATWAQSQAPTVIENIQSQLHGKQAASMYEPASVPRILLPLGTRFGVGQLPGPGGGATAAPTEVVIQRKGVDLFTARFAERFNA